MKSYLQAEPTNTVFLQTVSVALMQLKRQLQHDYEQAYPDLGEIVHLVLDEEESRAWELSVFPHLLLPDLVEAHVARLNLQPVKAKHADVRATENSSETDPYQSALALAA